MPQATRSPFRTPRLAGALLALLALPAALPLAAAAPAARPQLAFAPGAIEISGLSANTEVLLFAVAREPLGYLTRVSRREEVLEADGTGAARFELLSEEGEPLELPLKAVWVAVDLATGQLASSATPGFPAVERPLPPGGLRRGPGNRVNRLVDRLESAELLLVRPGDPESRGIWGQSVMDGNVFDRSEPGDGEIEAALDELAPLAGGPPAPGEVLAGDVLILVDPRTLTFFAVRLTA